MQAAVELVLGFERSWVNEENLAVNQARFRAWTDAFTGIPYDLPGFSKLSLTSLNSFHYFAYFISFQQAGELRLAPQAPSSGWRAL